MIKKSIYRYGGNLNWASTLGQVKEVFSKAKPGPCISITAGGKAWGKSTAFEYLSEFAPSVAVEGDIMSVLAASVYAKVKLTDDMTMTAISSGTAVPGFIPWTVEVEGDKDEAYLQALTSILGEGWNDKISLSTSFRGWKGDVVLRIVPDYKYYTNNMETRTKAMLADKTKSDEWRAHIKLKHKVQTWPEFHSALQEQIEMGLADGATFYVPNFGAGFDQALLGVAKLALEYTEEVLVSGPTKTWKL
jgi:hypothetical protein